MRFMPIKYEIHGVDLWAAEDSNGFILKYCNSKEDAIEACENEEKEGKQHLEDQKRAISYVEVVRR